MHLLQRALNDNSMALIPRVGIITTWWDTLATNSKRNFVDVGITLDSILQSLTREAGMDLSRITELDEPFNDTTRDFEERKRLLREWWIGHGFPGDFIDLVKQLDNPGQDDELTNDFN